jgi:hypothetical protein
MIKHASSFFIIMPEENNVIAGNWVSDVLFNRAALACRNVIDCA